MTEEKKEGWLNYLALTTVILAVCSTMASFKGGGHSTKSVLSQTQASDQWAFYQSKSIKGYLYELQRDALQLELAGRKGAIAAEVAAEYTNRVAAYAAKVKKYEQEKAEIERKARELEAIRDSSSKHSAAFGVAVIFLQIAILLSSIAALMKKKLLWLAGVGVGVVGIAHFMNGFLLFMK